MTDRELLEMAAKAAGIKSVWQDGWFPGIVGPGIGDIDVPWNPLNNDGQALRLVVELKLDILWAEHEKSVVVCNDSSNDDPVTEKVRFTTDPYAATRRAIVRAAAEIGKAMTQGDNK